MSYHDLSSCTLNADERREEADRICEMIIVDGDGDLTSLSNIEHKFVFQCANGYPISVKQLFWLRDIKDKLN